MAVEHEKFKLAQQVAKMAAEMSVFKQGGAIATPMASSCAPSPNLEADLLHQQIIKQELDDYPFALPTPRASLGSSAFSPESSSSLSSRSPSPSNALGIETITTSPDMTQHPAEMLCGLPCQSGVWLASIPPTSRDEAQRYQQAQMMLLISTHLFSLTLISAVYSNLLHPLHRIFNSLRTGSSLLKTAPAQASMLSLLIRWLISTPANLTPTMTSNFSKSTRTAKPLTTSSTQTKIPTNLRSTSNTSLRPKPTIRISMLRRLLLCSPALARPLRAATGRAMRLKTNHALRRTSIGNRKGVSKNGRRR